MAIFGKAQDAILSLDKALETGTLPAITAAATEVREFLHLIGGQVDAVLEGVEQTTDALPAQIAATVQSVRATAAAAERVVIKMSGTLDRANALLEQGESLLAAYTPKGGSIFPLTIQPTTLAQSAGHNTKETPHA